jgi:regulator-associated protein of mTOR
MQLPVVLQVLLSQGHRLRALVLLARFLDKGSWAVNLVFNRLTHFLVLLILCSIIRDQ